MCILTSCMAGCIYIYIPAFCEVFEAFSFRFGAQGAPPLAH